MTSIRNIVCALPLLLLAWGCSGNGGSREADVAGDSGIIGQASLLSVVEHAGYTDVKITNPWDTASLLARYVLVPQTDSLPDDLPDGTVLRTPLTSALVFSNVHAALLHELGHASAVTGVTDVGYITDSIVARGITAGSVADCGQSTDPDIEKIVMLSPQAIMLSPYSAADGVAERLGRLGIPVIMCADYMEPDPLGRAEWMRFYGRLVGEGERADSLYGSVAAEYSRVRALAAGVDSRPSVLIDTRYGDVWYVPVAGSTTDCFIADAGGSNPFSDLGHGDSRPLSVEQVIATAGNADFWLVRYFAGEPMTMAQFAELGPEISRFEAFRRNRVYGCNTSTTAYYDVVPFHPQYLLGNMARILHPELADSIPPSPYDFYRPIEQ